MGVGCGVSSVRVEPLAYPSVEVSTPNNLIKDAVLKAELVNPLMHVGQTCRVIPRSNM